MSAEAIIKGERSPFELIDASKLSDELHEQDCYRISPHLNADQLIREYFEALKYGRATPVYAQLPESGDVVLKHIAGDQVRVFVVPESERSVLEVADCHIHIPHRPLCRKSSGSLAHYANSPSNSMQRPISTANTKPP